MTSKDDFASFMENAFSSESNRALRRLDKGDVVTGTVVQISNDCVFVDIGSRADGRIARAELEDEKGELGVKVGDRIEATVLDAHAAGGPLLAVALARDEIDISTLQFAMQNSVPVEGKVTRRLNAGLEVEIGVVRAFCPASQIELGYAADLSSFIDHSYRFIVLEIRDGGRSVVVSRRAMLERERAEKAKALEQQLEAGQDREGIVQSIQKYGAFVDLGGVQGLLHISELVHGRVERVEDVVQVGETVRVRILEIEKTKKGTKISLSMKALQQPDEREVAKVGADEVLKGKVSRLLPFGLFVETAKGEGLVPTNQLPLAPGSDHRRAYPVGKEVEVVLLEQEPSSGRLRFSISGVIEAAERENYRDYEVQKKAQSVGEPAVGSFGELLQKQLGVKPSQKRKKPTPPSPAVKAENARSRENKREIKPARTGVIRRGRRPARKA
jgi:small subunit ribosomal protein S1